MTPLNFYGQLFPVVELPASTPVSGIVHQTFCLVAQTMLYWGPDRRITLCSYFDTEDRLRAAIADSLIRPLRKERLYYLDTWFEGKPKVPRGMLRLMWLLDWLHHKGTDNARLTGHQLAQEALKTFSDSTRWSQTPLVRWLYDYINNLEGGRYD